MKEPLNSIASHLEQEREARFTDAFSSGEAAPLIGKFIPSIN